MNKQVILFYGGFPKSFEEALPINPANKIKLETLKEGIYLTKDSTMNKFVNYLCDTEENVLSKVRGFNFSILFERLVKGEMSLSDINIPKYLFIYSIGSETAVNKEYSGTILNYFIDKVILQGSFLFLEGVPKLTLNNRYKIETNIDNFSL